MKIFRLLTMEFYAINGLQGLVGFYSSNEMREWVFHTGHWRSSSTVLVVEPKYHPQDFFPIRLERRFSLESVRCGSRIRRRWTENQHRNRLLKKNTFQRTRFFEVVDLFDKRKLRTGNFPKDEKPTLLKKFSVIVLIWLNLVLIRCVISIGIKLLSFEAM